MRKKHKLVMSGKGISFDGITYIFNDGQFNRDAIKQSLIQQLASDIDDIAIIRRISHHEK